VIATQRRPQMADSLAAVGQWLEHEGLELDERVVASLPRPDLVIGGRRVVSFCSNNYLGLSHLYPVKRAARRALARYSYATTESRKLGGNLQILEQLESRISEFKSAEAAMVCATGLLTNVAAIPAIVDAHGFSSHFYGMPRQSKEHLILFDAGAHQSIRMSLRIARSKSIKFAHNNMQDLERLLSEHRSMDVLIITEGAFSMDGDLSPLAAVADLAGEFDAALYVDDAHGTGVYGPKGRGVVEHFGIASARVSFHMGTFSKAFGAMGGFLAGDAPLIRVLKSFAPGYRFTSSLPAEVAAGIVAGERVAAGGGVAVAGLAVHRQVLCAIAVAGLVIEHDVAACLGDVGPAVVGDLVGA